MVAFGICFLFKQKTAYEMRISDWSSDVCSSDLIARRAGYPQPILHGLCTYGMAAHAIVKTCCGYDAARLTSLNARFSSPVYPGEALQFDMWRGAGDTLQFIVRATARDVVVMSRSEEHTSELHSLMRISSAVFCLNKKK